MPKSPPTALTNNETIGMRAGHFKFSVTLSNCSFCTEATCKGKGVAVQYQLTMQSTGKNKFAKDPKSKEKNSKFEFAGPGERVTFLEGYMMTTSNGTTQ